MTIDHGCFFRSHLNCQVALPIETIDVIATMAVKQRNRLSEEMRSVEGVEAKNVIENQQLTTSEQICFETAICPKATAFAKHSRQRDHQLLVSVLVMLSIVVRMGVTFFPCGEHCVVGLPIQNLAERLHHFDLVKHRFFR